MNRRTISPLSNLIHSIRSRYDYRKHCLCPLRTSPVPSHPAQRMPFCKPPFRDDDESVNGGYEEESQMRPILERSISKGRWIYWHDLMLEFSSFSAHVIYSVVKHVASNPYTKYRPYPTPAQFAASQDLISRQRHGHRREENTPSPQQAVLVESSSSKAFLSLQLPFVVSIALFLYSCNV